MSSRSTRLWATLSLVFVFLFSGCKILDDPPPQSAFTGVGPAQPDCLSDLPDKIGAYFQGEMQEDSEIAAMSDCIGSGLQTFMDLTRGSIPNNYTGEEIQSFFNRYFITGQKISNGLRVEAMKLKRSLIGGDAVNLTRTEIERVIEFTRILKFHAPRFKKMMPLTGEHARALSPREVIEGTRAIREAAEAFGRFFTGNGGPYSFADADNLLKELENSYPSAGGSGSGIRLIREQLPVFKMLKALLLNSTEEEITAAEWSRFLGFGARIHAIYLNWAKEKTDHSHDWFTPQGLDALERIAVEALDLLSEAALENPNGIVSGNLILRLVDLLREMKTQPDRSSHETTVLIGNFVSKGLLAKQVLLGGNSYEINLNMARPLKTLINLVKGPFYRVHERIVRANVREMPDAEFEDLLHDLEADVAVVTGAFESFRAHGRGDPETLNNLLDLIGRVGDLLETQQERDDLREFVTLGFAVKNFAVGRPYNSISTSDWLKLIARGQKLGKIYLRSLRPIRYGGGGSREQADLDHWWLMAEAGLEAFIEIAGDRHPGGGRSGEGIAEIAEIIAMIDALPANMRRELFPEPGRYEQWRLLASEIGVLKSGLVGGSERGFSSNDIRELLRIARVVKNQVRGLMVWFPLSMDDIGSWPRSRAEEFAELVRQTGVNIGQAFESGTKGSYQLADLQRLVDRAGFLFTADTSDMIRRMIPLAGAAKAVLVRPPHTAIQEHDWADMFRSLGHWGGWGIEFFHMVKEGHPISWGDTFFRFGNLMERCITLIHNATRNRGGVGARTQRHGILFSDWDVLLDEVFDFAEREEMELPLTRETTKAFLRPLFRRMLGGLRWDETGRNANGLRPEAVLYLQERFRWWKITQDYLHRAYSELGRAPEVFTADGFDRATLIRKLDEIRGRIPGRSDLSAPEKQLHTRIVDNIKTIINTYRPMYLGNDDFISFVNDNRREHLYSFHNMSAMNIYYVLCFALMQSYADNRERAGAGSGIEVLELERFVVDTIAVIKEMKFGNPNQTPQSLSSQRFMEANLFTSQANGNRYFDLWEGVEYLGMLLSARANTQRVYDYILTVCEHGELDFAGKPKIAVDCWRRHFFDRDRFHQFFTPNVPRTAWYYKVSPEHERVQYARDLEAAARSAKGSDVNKPIDSAEAESFVMVPFYVESLFKRFDTNRTGLLSINEAMHAYPVVCPVILTATNGRFSANCQYGESGFVDAVFGYLLKYGTPPPERGDSFFDDLAEIFEFLGWNVTWAFTKITSDDHDPFNLRFTVNRTRIMNIVGSLARQSSSSSTESSSVRPARSALESERSRVQAVDQALQAQ